MVLLENQVGSRYRPFSGDNWTDRDYRSRSNARPARAKANAAGALSPRSAEQALIGHRTLAAFPVTSAQKQQGRKRHRRHRIVRLSPCFCTHWPLCRPKDATKLNKSLHCTVDGTDRSRAIQTGDIEENKTEKTARLRCELPDDLEDSSEDSNHPRGLADHSTKARARAVEHFACSDVIKKEMTSARRSRRADIWGTESLGKSNNGSWPSIAWPESGRCRRRLHTIYAMRAGSARHADAGACRLLAEGERE
jgi:hypothetical protein